jgi:fucose permease
VHCFHFGVQNAYQGFLVLYMVKGIGWTKSESLTLTTVHYACYCFARILGIMLSKVLPPSVILITCLLLTELAFVLDLSLIASWSSIAWISSAILGISISLVVPSSFTWVRDHIEVTGRTAAIIRLISTIGLSGIPAILGNLFNKYGSVTFDATLLAANCMTIIISLILFVALRKFHETSAGYSLDASFDGALSEKDINNNKKHISSTSLKSLFLQ